MTRFINFIWDFDGTLYDTYPRMARVFSRAAARLGVECPYGEALARIKKSVGAAAEEVAPGRRGALLAEYRAVEATLGFDGMRPYAGMPELLRGLAADGGRHFLYTHRDALAPEALRVDGLLDLFSGWVTADDRFPAKPAPNALMALMARHALAPRECAMVGDRSLDVEAAKNAGVAGVLFDPEGFYDDYGAKLRARSVSELDAILRRP